MKNNSKLCSILAAICIICAMVCVAVLTANLDGREGFKRLVYVIGFLFGGCLGSYIIAKFVINKDVETKMSELSDTVRRDEKEKQTFLKNLNWVITTWMLKGVPRNRFKTDAEYDAYNQGRLDAAKELQENYLKRLRFGVVETNTMFTDDWTKDD